MSKQIEKLLITSAQYFGLSQQKNNTHDNQVTTLLVSRNRNSFLNNNSTTNELAAKAYGLGHQAEFLDSQNFLSQLDNLSLKENSNVNNNQRSMGFFNRPTQNRNGNVINFPATQPKI